MREYHGLNCKCRCQQQDRATYDNKDIQDKRSPKKPKLNSDNDKHGFPPEIETRLSKLLEDTFFITNHNNKKCQSRSETSNRHGCKDDPDEETAWWQKSN